MKRRRVSPQGCSSAGRDVLEPPRVEVVPLASRPLNRSPRFVGDVATMSFFFSSYRGPSGARAGHRIGRPLILDVAEASTLPVQTRRPAASRARPSMASRRSTRPAREPADGRAVEGQLSADFTGTSCRSRACEAAFEVGEADVTALMPSRRRGAHRASRIRPGSSPTTVRLGLEIHLLQLLVRDLQEVAKRRVHAVLGFWAEAGGARSARHWHGAACRARLGNVSRPSRDRLPQELGRGEGGAVDVGVVVARADGRAATSASRKPAIGRSLQPSCSSTSRGVDRCGRAGLHVRERGAAQLAYMRRRISCGREATRSAARPDPRQRRAAYAEELLAEQHSPGRSGRCRRRRSRRGFPRRVAHPGDAVVEQQVARGRHSTRRAREVDLGDAGDPLVDVDLGARSTSGAEHSRSVPQSRRR